MLVAIYVILFLCYTPSYLPPPPPPHKKEKIDIFFLQSDIFLFLFLILYNMFDIF